MTDSAHEKKLAKLTALRAAFAAGLPERMEAIAACWRAAEAADPPQQVPTELIRLAHSLAGSAGTFGYHRLGDKARELEEALAQTSRVVPPDAATRTTRIHELIAALRPIAQEGPDGGQGGVAADLLQPGHEDQTPRDNCRIVLIEDDTLVAQDLATQLSMFGWEVSVFDKAAAARSALQAPWPAALVVDIALPEGSLAGLELMHQLQYPAGVTVPHVVISARSDWESRLAAVRSGAAAYMVKPVDVAALAAQLDRVTHRTIHVPYRVLVVDDDEMLAMHHAQTLSAAGMEATALTEPARLLDALAEHQPEIVLLDLYMPDCSGLEALRVIRQDPQYASLPVVFLSTETGLAQQHNAMKIGAEDFLTKPISGANLIMAVTVRAERFRALSMLIRQDSLTGLLNHIAFKLRLEGEIDRSRREHQPISLAMVDIDHFKKVNDTYGHPVGDRVIKGLAQLMSKRLRKSDIIGRYGGEEFVVAMPNTPPALAIDIMNELRESFGKLRFESSQGEFTCTFSCGVATALPSDNAASLVAAADDALYQAKRSGRNRVEASGRNEA